MNIREMQTQLMFDRMLKERVMLKQDETARARYIFQKKYLSKIKVVALFFYYVIIPFFHSPPWCISAVKNEKR